MKTFATILAGAALAVSGVSAASAETLAERGEARLAEMLQGRVAGEPVSCITPNRSRNLQVIEHVGVVYDDGDTIYVARPTDPRQLGRMDTVVIDRFSNQLCRYDVRRTVDRYQGHITGPVFLQDFVPYTKNG